MYCRRLHLYDHKNPLTKRPVRRFAGGESVLSGIKGGDFVSDFRLIDVRLVAAGRNTKMVRRTPRRRKPDKKPARRPSRYGAPGAADVRTAGRPGFCSATDYKRREQVIKYILFQPGRTRSHLNG